MNEDLAALILSLYHVFDSSRENNTGRRGLAIRIDVKNTLFVNFDLDYKKVDDMITINSPRLERMIYSGRDVGNIEKLRWNINKALRKIRQKGKSHYTPELHDLLVLKLNEKLIEWI